MIPKNITPEMFEKSLSCTGDILDWSANSLSFLGSNIHHDKYIVQSYFLNAVAHQPPSFFDTHKDHPFWSTWKSKKSGFRSDIIAYSLSMAKDPLWNEKLIKALDPSPDNAQMYSDSFASSPLQNHNDFLKTTELLKKKGLFKPTPKILLQQSRSGNWATIKALIDQGFFSERSPGVEKIWFQRLRGIVNKNSLAPIRQSEIFEFLWEKWGVPSAKDMECFFAISVDIYMRNTRKQNATTDGFEFLTKYYNGTSNAWSRQSARDFVRSCLHHNQLNIIKDKLNEGWDIRSEDVQWAADNFFGPYTRSELTRPDFEAAVSKFFIEKHLKDSVPERSAPRSMKKM